MCAVIFGITQCMKNNLKRNNNHPCFLKGALSRTSMSYVAELKYVTAHSEREDVSIATGLITVALSAELRPNFLALAELTHLMDFICSCLENGK